MKKCSFAMCRSAMKNCQSFRCEYQAPGFLLFLAVFSTLLFVERTQSMPSRSQRQFSYTHRPDIIKEEYDEPVGRSGFDRPEYSPPRGFNNNYSRAGNEGRETTEGRPGGATQGRNPADGDAIEFPGEFSRNTGNFVPVPVPNCEGKTFCEETASAYPQEYMTNIISRTSSIQVFSGVDEEPVVADRFDSSDGGESLCGSETKIVYPKTAKNTAKEWLFIMQDEKQGYKQGVKVENCNAGTAEGACKIIEGSILGYETSCKQKYVSRVLAALQKNGTVVTENFSMPSSCCCQIRHVGDVRSRFGITNSKAPQTPAIRNGRRQK